MKSMNGASNQGDDGHGAWNRVNSELTKCAGAGEIEIEKKQPAKKGRLSRQIKVF